MTVDPVLVATRRSLHAVAELVLAGPQFARSASIELRVVDDGFATVRAPDLRVTVDRVRTDGHDVTIDGRSAAALAAAVGVEAVSLAEVYSGGPGVTAEEVLVVDAAAARRIVDALGAGDAALRALAPDSVPVLWPEHFDVGITVDEVNYGLSPGDDHLPEPYAYVGPWSRPALDDFWNAHFCAARPVADLMTAEGVRAFFEDGRARLGR
jgi:hypothetical protein